MIHLDWQTEEEEGWGVEPPETPEPVVRSWRKKRRVLLVALFALIAAIFVIGRRVELQVAQVERDTREAILSTHDLILQAVAEKDKELFSTLTTGGDAWWIDLQGDLVKEGLFIDRYPLGLVQKGPAGEGEINDLAPDLNQATVVFNVDYQVVTTDGLTETIALQQAMHYINKGSNWQYTRPDIDTWGDWQVVEENNIRVSYREIEGELGERLARNLIQAIAGMCQYSGACPERTEIVIRLEETLNGLAQVSRSIFPVGQRITIGIPSPLLIGHPQDEAAYQALFQGYARQIISFLILEWEISDLHFHAQSYQDALVRRRLVDLGLAGWPTMGNAPQNLPPYLFPEQSLATICVSVPGQGSELLIYNLQDESWASALSGEPFSHLQSLPDDSGVLIGEINPDATQNQRLLIWRPGDPLLTLDGVISVSIDREGPGGTVQIVDQGFGWHSYRLPDFDRCTPAGCDLQTVEQPVTQWSPDGRFRLYREQETEQYMLRDLDSGNERMIGAALSAFWVDEQTIALVRSENYNRQDRQIWRVDAVTGDQSSVAILNELLEAVEIDNIPNGYILEIVDIVAWPGRADTYLVAIAPIDLLSSFFPYPTTMYILSVRSGPMPDVNLLASVEGQVYAPLKLSPTGRWLSVSGIMPDDNSTGLLLIDLEQNQLLQYDISGQFSPFWGSDFDWSADGNWLAIANEGVLELIAPGTNYVWKISPPSAGCHYVTWLNN